MPQEPGRAFLVFSLRHEGPPRFCFVTASARQSALSRYLRMTSALRPPPADVTTRALPDDEPVRGLTRGQTELL
jgi:hypothetical protein